MNIVAVYDEKMPYNDWKYTRDGMAYCLNKLGENHTVKVLCLSDTKQKEVLERERFTVYFMVTEKDIFESLMQDKPDRLILNATMKILNLVIGRKLRDVYKAQYYHGGFLLDPAMFYCDKFIVQTETQKKNLLNASGNLVDPDGIAVIPYGVDTSVFKPLDTDKEFMYVYQGTFVESKRQDMAVEAIKKIDGNLLLFGRVWDDWLYKKCLEVRDKCPSKITILDWALKHEDVVKRLNSAVVALQLGIEGGTRGTSEIMACGLPIVTVWDSGAVRDIVEISHGGVIVDNNLPSLIRGMKSAFTWHIVLGKNALDYAKRELTADLMYERLKEALNVE